MEHGTGVEAAVRILEKIVDRLRRLVRVQFKCDVALTRVHNHVLRSGRSCGCRDGLGRLGGLGGGSRRGLRERKRGGRGDQGQEGGRVLEHDRLQVWRGAIITGLSRGRKPGGGRKVPHRLHAGSNGDSSKQTRSWFGYLTANGKTPIRQRASRRP